MKTTTPKLSAIVLATSLLVFSCKKETSEADLSPQEEEQSSMAITEAEAESETVFNDVFDNVVGANSEVGLEGIGVFGRTAGAGETERVMGCYNITVTRLVAGQAFPLRITVDFGAGCTGRDGRTRSGKIITEYTGRLIVPGKSSTTSFENYTVDSISVEGTFKISNTGSANTRQFTVEVVGAKLTKPNGNYIKRSSKRMISQIEGLGSPELPRDDIFSITGEASGEVKKESLIISWESKITEPLIKKFSCPWISKGLVGVARTQAQANSQWAAQLNYGNGECDNTGILTVNGIEHQIVFH